MCGATERRKKMISENSKIQYIHMIQPSKWSSSPLKFKNQDLHDLFLEILF